MREFRSSGSVRGVPSNGHPYRDNSPKSYALMTVMVGKVA